MKIGLIGAGRLGLCLALLMEEAGYDVIASDVRADYIASLNQKVIDTTEPEVKDLLRQLCQVQLQEQRVQENYQGSLKIQIWLLQMLAVQVLILV